MIFSTTHALGDRVRVIEFNGRPSKKVGEVCEVRDHETHPYRVRWPNGLVYYYRRDQIEEALRQPGPPNREAGAERATPAPARRGGS